MKKNPVKITDMTLRDGQQSLLATRMTTADMARMAPEMNKAGFYTIEVWGGATFDVATRFLNEDPWERLALMKKLIPDTPLQMLLRGQNLVGYRHYPDDIVRAFIKHACDLGMDVFRVFDALNDERNLKTALEAIKECGKCAQLSICYSITEPKMGGPIYNLDYYINKACILDNMGADSVCIKDMGGIIAPDDAYTLVKALKRETRCSIQLHTHYTSGMGSMSYLKAVEAGVDIIDTVLGPFGLRSSQPAIEPVVAALRGTARDTGLDMAQLFKLGQMLESIASSYREFQDTTHLAVIDTSVLMHQVPGGMLSNLIAQMREAGVLERIDEVYKELPRLRQELGYPPLVTPLSQMLGAQAVNNVLFGRYKRVNTQIQDYVYGLYGKPPSPIAPEIQQLVLKDYKKGQTPVTVRPADLLEPEMSKAVEATKGIARDAGDILTYALFPTTGMQFLKRKYGMETAGAKA